MAGGASGQHAGATEARSLAVQVGRRCRAFLFDGRFPMRAIERLLGVVTLCTAGSLAQAQLVQRQPLLYVDWASMAKCPDGLSWATAYTTLEEALYWAAPAAGRFICVRANSEGCDSTLDTPSVVESIL